MAAGRFEGSFSCRRVFVTLYLVFPFLVHFIRDKESLQYGVAMQN